MRTVALLVGSLLLGGMAFALDLDGDLSGEWRIEAIEGSEPPISLTLSPSHLVTSEEFGSTPVYHVNTNGELGDVFGASISPLFQGHRYIVWHSHQSNRIDTESNMILRVEDDALVLGGDFEEQELAIMRRISATDR